MTILIIFFYGITEEIDKRDLHGWVLSFVEYFLDASAFVGITCRRDGIIEDLEPLKLFWFFLQVIPGQK